MKLFKKVLSVAAALALVVTAVPANAKAATDAVDFEDGNVPSAISMKVDDGGDVSLLSVADINGSKALFVDVQDAALVPKVAIDISALVGSSNIDKVRTIQFDFTIVNPSGEAVGWNGGSFGANIGADGSQWYDPADWTIQDDDNAQTETQKMSDTFVPGMGFTKDAPGSGYLFMKWAGSNDFYIDNLQFLDEAGNPLALAAADTATEEAAADDSAAAADVPKTGVIGLGIVYGLGALATGAVALKRRKR
jgi:hypothetical protein